MKSNLVYSVIGVVFQTLFPLIIYPYITRVLGVANLGEYNFYASTVAFLALFSGFGISLYGTKEIGKRKDDIQAYSVVFGELVSINLIMSFIIYILIFVLILFAESYQNYKLFLITSITIIGNAVGAEYLFVALEKQKFMLIRNIIFKILSLVFIFSFVRDESDLIAYAIIMLISTAGVSVTNILNYINKIDWKVIRLKNFHIAACIIPLVQVFIMDTMNHYYGTMDIVILGNLDTVESVGYYSVASKIYFLSYTFLASTAVPLLPRAAYYIENRLFVEYDAMLRRCYDIYLLIILFSSFVLFFYAEDIIVLVSGEKFRQGYKALQLFALTLLPGSFCNLFIFEVLYPKNKNKFVLTMLSISIVINLILSVVLIPAMSYMGAAVAFLSSFVILFVLFVVGGRKELPHFEGNRDFVKEIVGIGACYGACVLLKYTSIHFIIQLVLCSLLFFLIEFVLRNDTAIYLYQLVKNRIKARSRNNE